MSETKASLDFTEDFDEMYRALYQRGNIKSLIIEALLILRRIERNTRKEQQQ